ncbi:hypothetical protein LCGC14_0853310 [marine sediment metagenome]|uniref:Uncharacterized protein n=1 Tax=marine sediment metagenome TaxID=412755 RepID=A0A0F9PEF8_9ZZZZ
MTFYPDRVYPESPDFPEGHEDVPLGPDLYLTVTTYIPELVNSLIPFLDFAGNIEIGATEGISWNAIEQLDISGSTIVMQSLQANELFCQELTTTTLIATGNLIIDNDLVMQGTSDLSVAGTVTQDHVDRGIDTLTQAAEPGDPADNNAVFWLSNGTGAGDAGDFMCKITEGGGTTTFTIADYSAL